MHRFFRIVSSAAAVIVCLVISGCLDVTTTTTVNTDGSLTKKIVFSGDSSALVADAARLSIDSTWEWKWEKGESRSVKATVTRTFPDDEALTAAMPGRKGETFGVRAKLTKRFRWFFTSYRYDETWLRFNPFDTIPITDYLGSWELAQFYQHEVEKKPYATKGDSLAQESAGPRFEEWEARNLFDSYFRAFLDGVAKIQSRSLTVAGVKSQEDTLYKVAGKWLKMNNIDTVASLFRRVLKNPVVPKAIAANEGAFTAMKSRMRFVNDVMGEKWEGRIVLPGLLTSTNAPGIEGSTAIWADFPHFAYIDDFDLWAESRVTNWWAIILTGILVAGIVGFYLFASLRRR